MLPVQVSHAPAVRVPEGFHSPSIVASTEDGGRVVFRSRASLKAAGVALAPVAFTLPNVMRTLSKPHSPGWLVGLSLFSMLAAIAMAAWTARTGGQFQLWFEPRRWGYHGIFRRRAFSPETAATAHVVKYGRYFLLKVTTTQDKSVKLCQVHDEPTALELVRILQEYAAAAGQQGAELLA
jgi:hypothetical protein